MRPLSPSSASASDSPPSSSLHPTRESSLDHSPFKREESDDDEHPFALDLDPDDPLNLLVHSSRSRTASSRSSALDPDSMDADQQAYPPQWPPAEEIVAHLTQQAQQQQQQQQHQQQQHPHYQQQQQQQSPQQFTFNFKPDDPSLAYMDTANSFDFTNYFPFTAPEADQAHLFVNPNMTTMAVSPADLHFDFPSQQAHPLHPQQAFDQQQGGYPFTFGTDMSLAIPCDTSMSSSGSDASLSPIMDNRGTPASAPSPESTSSLSHHGASQPQPQQHSHFNPSSAQCAEAELVQQVMRLTGVQRAVPGTGAQAQAADLPFSIESIFSRLAAHQASSSPLPHPTPPASDTTGSPEPSAFPPSIAGQGSASTPPTANGKPSRGKTSHTTIERRYRTNLNARITALKKAVPALRVLEKKSEESKDGAAGDASDEELVVDERGFVDGVKVARKGSKATVLGKAVEYIRVLKKREIRLARERSALASLLSSLVGGPALLREFEAHWKELYGGAERDELTDAELVDLRGSKATKDGAVGVGSDDDGDGEGDDDDDDDDGEGRPRKKIKAVGVPVKKDTSGTAAAKKEKKPPAPMPLGPDGMPLEKRKRGRPRKQAIAPAPPPVGSVNDVPRYPPADMSFMPFQTQQQQQQQQQQTQAQPVGTYVLAAFAFLSFFDSPLTSSSRRPQHTGEGAPHTHEGSVLSSPSYASKIPTVPDTWEWHDVIRIFHLFVSALVLLSILAPWLPSGPTSKVKKALRNLRFGLRPARIVGFLASPGSAFAASHRARGATAHSTQQQQRQRSPSGSASSSDEDGDGSSTFSSGTTASQTASTRAALLAALHPSRRGTTTEAEGLRAALGAQSGVVGLVQCLVEGLVGRGRRRRELEVRGLEQRAWVRLAECVALDTSTPLGTRLQTYWCMSSHISFFSACTSDLATLALLIHPFSSTRGAALWARAKAADIMRPYEHLALEMSVDEAVAAIGAYSSPSLADSPVGQEGEEDNDEAEEDSEETHSLLGTGTPLGLVAAIALRRRIRAHAETMFLRATGCAEDEVLDEERQRVEVVDHTKLVECAESLNMVPALALARLFERACNPEAPPLPLTRGGNRDKYEEEEVAAHLLSSDSTPTSTSSGGRASAEAEYAQIGALLRAVLLYRRLFPSTILQAAAGAGAGYGMCSGAGPVSMILSPPPSPSRRNTLLRFALRKELGSPAFFARASLEDARDRVVDMLVPGGR